MSAPKHAYVIGSVPDYEKTYLEVKCLGCGWMGYADQLLGVDDEDTLWCPECRTSGWIYL